MKITIKNLQDKIPLNQSKIRSAIRAVLLRHRLYSGGAITVCMMDDRLITSLNARYRGIRAPTDVIAFTLSGPKNEPLVADIAVSTDTARRNAKLFGTNPLYEVYLYVIHGVLHVLGYDDATSKQRARMQKKCEYFLRMQGIDLCLSIKQKQ